MSTEKAYLLVLDEGYDDGHTDNDFVVCKTEEDAREAFRRYLEDPWEDMVENYEGMTDADQDRHIKNDEWVDDRGNTFEECIEKLTFSSGDNGATQLDVYSAEVFKKDKDSAPVGKFNFEMDMPMEDMLFYKINSGGDGVCHAENDRYVATILLSESAKPTYITYEGKDYDLVCVHGDDYKKLLPEKAQEYIRKHDDWLCGKDSPFTDYSLGNDPDLVIYDKKLDEYISSAIGSDLAAEIEWDARKITEEDFRAFMKFALEHPHAFEEADYRFDITGWANSDSAKDWLPSKDVFFTSEECRKIHSVIRDSMHYHIYDCGCTHQYMDYIEVCDILLRKLDYDAEADEYMADAKEYAAMSKEALDE